MNTQRGLCLLMLWWQAGRDWFCSFIQRTATLQQNCIIFFFLHSSLVWHKWTTVPGTGIRWEGHLQCECERLCARVCVDSDMTSSLDGPFHSVHSCHAGTADEVTLIVTTHCCCSSDVAMWLGLRTETADLNNSSTHLYAHSFSLNRLFETRLYSSECMPVSAHIAVWFVKFEILFLDEHVCVFVVFTSEHNLWLFK